MTDQPSDELRPITDAIAGDVKTGSVSSAPVLFPSSASISTIEENTEREEKAVPLLGSEVWQSPTTRSSGATNPAENAVNQAGLSPRGASRFP